MAIKRKAKSPNKIVDKSVTFEKSPLSVEDTVALARMEKKRFRKMKVTGSDGQVSIVIYLEISAAPAAAQPLEKAA